MVPLALKLMLVQADALFASVSIGFCGFSLERHSALATLTIVDLEDIIGQAALWNYSEEDISVSIK